MIRHHYALLCRELEAKVARAAAAVAPVVTGWVGPRSVLDVGCGNGVWLAAFREAGGADVLGIDGDYIDPDALRVPPESFRACDLARPIDLGRRFDLAVCLEVAEHLPEAAADGFVRTLTRHADVVFFSAAIPGQGGTFHVNEQWQSYWVGRFAAEGYACIDAVRPRFWADPEVAFYYAQNAFLFVKADALPRYPELAAAGRDLPTNLVHPQWAVHADRELAGFRVPTLTTAVRQFPGALSRFVRRRVSPRRR